MQIEKIKPKLVNITKESGIPLIGCIAFGIIDRGSNLLQIRCTSSCNMKCGFCSTSANSFDIHPTNYIVDINYLFEETKKIAELKGKGVIIFLDSVGEPMSHPNFIELGGKLKTIEEVEEVVVITNGTFLSKEKIEKLKEYGLDRINVSLHSIDPERSKKLFGMTSYDVDKVKDALVYAGKIGLNIMVTPVWVPNVNDKDIEEVIKFSKENGFGIGLQKYETYRYSRKMKKAKKQTYWKFYNKIKEWEKAYDIKLKVRAEDLNVEKRERIPEVIDIGEKVYADIVCNGWLTGQMIGKAKDRCISVNECNKEIGDKVRVKIIENKNNIYLAECV